MAPRGPFPITSPITRWFSLKFIAIRGLSGFPGTGLSRTDVPAQGPRCFGSYVSEAPATMARSSAHSRRQIPPSSAYPAKAEPGSNHCHLTGSHFPKRPGSPRNRPKKGLDRIRHFKQKKRSGALKALVVAFRTSSSKTFAPEAGLHGERCPGPSKNAPLETSVSSWVQESNPPFLRLQKADHETQERNRSQFTDPTGPAPSLMWGLQPSSVRWYFSATAKLVRSFRARCCLASLARGWDVLYLPLVPQNLGKNTFPKPIQNTN